MESRNGINPYVSFYVDKQFKVLKNYPPYTYAWDSTTVPNGFHTVEALGYLESGRDTTTRRIRVYVDNAGGETKKNDDGHRPRRQTRRASENRRVQSFRYAATAAPSAKSAEAVYNQR